MVLNYVARTETYDTWQFHLINLNVYNMSLVFRSADITHSMRVMKDIGSQTFFSQSSPARERFRYRERLRLLLLSCPIHCYLEPLSSPSTSISQGA